MKELSFEIVFPTHEEAFELTLSRRKIIESYTVNIPNYGILSNGKSVTRKKLFCIKK